MARKKIMEKFRLDEISAVDRPAQSPALATIIKRAEAPVDMNAEDQLDAEGNPIKPKPKAKGKTVGKEYGERCSVTLLTSATEDHQHSIELYTGSNGGSTSYGSGDPKESGHSHPWVMTTAGEIVIGLTEGHDHSVDMNEVRAALFAATMKSDSPEGQSGQESGEQTAASAALEASTMDQKELDALKAQIADLTKAKDRAEAVAALPSEQRGHFDTLTAPDQDAFLGKSADERKSVVKALGDTDPVIYKSLDGSEFRKSDDPRVVMAVKRADDAVTAAKVDRDARETMELEKRAGETLPNLPGDLPVRAQLLKAVESIADEKSREGVLACLKAANTGIFERAKGTPEANGVAKGAGVKPSQTSAEDQLDALAEKRAKEKGEPLHKAYSEVLRTDEGAQLYVKFTEERAASAN